MFHSVKKWSGLNQERNLHRSSTVYKPKLFCYIIMHMLQDFDVKDDRRWAFSLEELWIVDSYFSRKSKKYLNDGFVSPLDVN